MAEDGGKGKIHLRNVLRMMLFIVTFRSSSSLSPELSASSSSSATKPHIIFILADDLGWHDVSWHNTKAMTPNLESLAKDGIILDQSYVQPVCTPTRAALLTGRYPFTIGRQHQVLKAQTPTGLLLNATLLPEALKEVGYSTHMVGKWHLGFCHWDYTPTRRGFDTFYGFYLGMGDHYSHNGGSFRSAENSPVGYDFRNDENPDFSVNGTYDTYAYSSYVEELLDARDPTDPMFLYLAFQAVHEPLQVPAKYREPFKYIGDEDREIYLGMAWAMDEAVGRIVDGLKATGHYENSIIIFSSDNGGSANVGNNWPLRGSKGTLWEGGTRAPGFIHSPLLHQKGFTSSTLLHVTDWYATIMGLVGGSPSEDTDGFDMWEALTIGTESPRLSMIYNIDNVTNDNGTEVNAAIRIGDFKLIMGSQGQDDWIVPPEGINPKVGTSTYSHKRMVMSKEPEQSENPDIQLFNVVVDPEERDNIADAYPTIVDNLLKELERELTRMIPDDSPESDPKSDPKYFDGVWSPGWCHPQ